MFFILKVAYSNFCRFISDSECVISWISADFSSGCWESALKHALPTHFHGLTCSSIIHNYCCTILDAVGIASFAESFIVMKTQCFSWLPCCFSRVRKNFVNFRIFIMRHFVTLIWTLLVLFLSHNFTRSTCVFLCY